jgi:uncharacterized protein YukE
MASKSLLRKLIQAGVVLAEDFIERIGDPDGSRVMKDALRKARDRAAELAVENARLHDRLEEMNRQLNDLQDRFAFNGPTLYSDEVGALKDAIRALCDFDDNHNPKAAKAIGALLDRSDHCPFTSVDLQKQIHGIISGETLTSPWPDEVDDANDFWEPSAPMSSQYAKGSNDDDIPF